MSIPSLATFAPCAVLFGLFIVAQSAAAEDTAPSVNATSEQMLQEIESLQWPQLDASRRADQTYLKSYFALQSAFIQKKGDLSKEFYARFPDHSKAMPLMQWRWDTLAHFRKAAQVLDEIDQMLAQPLDSAKRAEILYVGAHVRLLVATPGAAATQPAVASAEPAIEEFIQAAPKDERGALLLWQLSAIAPDSRQKDAINKRIVDAYPASDPAVILRGRTVQRERVGKPFDLTFTDAISGREISIQRDMKGKVIVIDFWATWCAPCVAEMPQNNELYARYKEKGVEFVGVGADRPGPEGLKSLRDFCDKNHITWPQYFEGKDHFSVKWGIEGIPSVFVVDAEGNLYSTDARGKLDELIPKLLKEEHKN